MSVWLELGVKGTVFAATSLYNVGRYLLFGPQQTDECKQITMLRKEVERMRDEQTALMKELKDTLQQSDSEPEECGDDDDDGELPRRDGSSVSGRRRRGLGRIFASYRKNRGNAHEINANGHPHE